MGRGGERRSAVRNLRFGEINSFKKALCGRFMNCPYKFTSLLKNEVLGVIFSARAWI